MKIQEVENLVNNIVPLRGNKSPHKKTNIKENVAKKAKIKNIIFQKEFCGKNE